MWYDVISAQDEAAQHSFMPYRAPELLEPTTGAQVSEATDMWVWMRHNWHQFNHLSRWVCCCSPWWPPRRRSSTRPATVRIHDCLSMSCSTGGNLALAIAQGKYQFPSNKRHRCVMQWHC